MTLIMLVVAFMAIYPVITGYIFPPQLANWIYSLFYPVLSINFLMGYEKTPDSMHDRADWLFNNPRSLLVSAFFIIMFFIILGRADIKICRILLIMCTSLITWGATTVICRRNITYALFMLNFWLFSGVFVLDFIWEAEYDTLSKFNPFGGLFITLFSGL